MERGSPGWELNALASKVTGLQHIYVHARYLVIIIVIQFRTITSYHTYVAFFILQ